MARKLRDGSLRRNFQGYTTDGADALIGLGASSIGRLPQGYVQNITATGPILPGVSEGRLPIARGFALSDADRATASAIEELMCQYAFSIAELRARFGSRRRCLQRRPACKLQRGRLRHLRRRHICHHPEGRPFVRTIAAKFDRYINQGQAKHSSAI
jgi:oxygen-independent coproporphyrinogen-3 oxidase